MLKVLLLFAFCVFGLAVRASGQDHPREDVIETSGGELRIRFIGHGSLMFVFGGKVVHVDPYGSQDDYSRLPKADLVMITHEHGDHLDQDALAKVRTDRTDLVLTEAAAEKVGGGIVMRNGEIKTVGGFRIEAVPAYNIVHKRPSGAPYHPRGIGNGYIITFGEKRVYIAGDTENTPEVKALRDIDIAFLPMNLPYTMTPAMVADAARAIKPEILYPYHFGDTDVTELAPLLKGSGIEIRIRDMQ